MEEFYDFNENYYSNTILIFISHKYLDSRIAGESDFLNKWSEQKVYSMRIFLDLIYYISEEYISHSSILLTDRRRAHHK